MMSVNDACARKFIKLMQERKITQYRLEQDSGVSHGAMNRILMGKNDTIEMKTFFKLCRALKVSPSKVLEDALFDFDNMYLD